MRKPIPFLLAGLLFIVFSCDEKEDVYPKIQTLEITPTFASSFLAKGNIVAIGDSPVIDYGFVYSTSSNPDIFHATKVGFGAVATTGPFERHISIEFPGVSTIYIRAFLTSGNGTVYGDVKEFALPLLTTASVTPIKAKAGEEVTITGGNFSIIPTENTVKFGEKVATVLSATPTSLVVQVPEGITDPIYYENITIIVITGGQEVPATQAFKILPSALDFSPKVGSFGTKVMLSGKDFSPVSAIMVGDQNVSAYDISYNSLSFNIPPTVTTAKLKISLMMENEVIELPGEFTIPPPTITLVTPLIGLGDSQIVISGTGFNLGDFLTSYNIVKVGTLEAVAFNATTTQITAFVPTGLSPGSYKVSVSTGVHTVTYGPSYVVTSPILTSFSPTSGVAGTYVTITGSHFGDLNPAYSVLIGSTPTEVYSWTDTSITVRIPVGTAPGTVKITLNIAGQSVTSSGNYTILP